MPKIPRDRLTLEEAKSLCAERILREAAGTAQSYYNWSERGVPWDVVGPLVVEQLSLASEAHAHLARHGGPAMHAVLDLQGRVFQLARRYGIESKEFQALSQFLKLYVPESSLESVPPSVAAALPRDGAVRRRKGLRNVTSR